VSIAHPRRDATRCIAEDACKYSGTVTAQQAQRRIATATAGGKPHLADD
jgi:hypothetical protein